MWIDAPAPEDLPGLRALWADAFGEEGGWLEGFFRTAFEREKCRCVTVDGAVAAGLFWFDGVCRGAKVAYLYAVATLPAFRGRGLCRRLLADTGEYLAARSYGGMVLVPGEPGLFRFYAGLGFLECAPVREFTAVPGPEASSLERIGPAEYGALRRELLPPGSVIQEGASLAYLETQAELYRGGDFLLAASREGDTLLASELLGNAGAAPGILTALGATRGSFRTPGDGRPYAMFRPLTPDFTAPAYFGMAFE